MSIQPTVAIVLQWSTRAIGMVYLGILQILLMVFRPHEIPSQRADTFDEEPADVKLLWQLLHVPAIFIGFLPLFFESYSG